MTNLSQHKQEWDNRFEKKFGRNVLLQQSSEKDLFQVNKVVKSYVQERESALLEEVVKYIDNYLLEQSSPFNEVSEIRSLLITNLKDEIKR